MINTRQHSLENYDAVDEALSWHDGDARATIQTLISDCVFLRQQLEIASRALSHGMTRGWTPKTDRID